MISLSRFLALILTAGIQLLATTTARSEQPTLYYILDASGSMWERIEGTPRISIAKQTLSSLLQGTPDNVSSGLAVYGHRRKGDCTDIEEVIDIAPLDATTKDDALDRIASITARGMTPIAATIKQAISLLKNRETESTIVLISDGLESCGGDPCALTRNLKTSGVKFVIHVVGFGLDNKQADKLSCISEAGGGVYFTAENAAELFDALEKVQKSVIQKTEIEAEPIPKPPPQKVTSSSTSITIKVTGPGTVKLVPASWVKDPRYWALIDPESGKEAYQFKTSGTETQIVPSGTYQLAWRQTEYTSRTLELDEIIRVETGNITEVPLNTGIRLNLPQWVKRPKWWGLMSATNEPENPDIWFREIHEQLVPSGSYELLWKQTEYASSLVRLGSVEIKPDILNSVDVMTAIHLVRADWVPEKVKYWSLMDDQDNEVAWFRDFNPNFVPAGSYRLLYRQSKHGSTNSILGKVEVVEGKLTEFPLNTGVTFAVAEGTKAPKMIEFIRLDEESQPVSSVKLNNSWGPMLLQPGTYRIDFQAKNHGPVISIVESFELPQGTLVEIEM